jgi:hypothetical protein
MYDYFIFLLLPILPNSEIMKDFDSELGKIGRSKNIK